MELLICVLNEPNLLHDVIAAFVEGGAAGGTVIESHGMGRILSQDIPIFAGFRHLLSGSRPHNHTLFAVVDGMDTVRDIEALVRDVLADAEDEHAGVLFSVPVSRFTKLAP